MMADQIGTKEKLIRANEIKRELDTALRLNPNDETALSMLGSYYREAAQIGWFRRMVANTFIGEVPKGNYELAEKAFRKSIALDGEIIRNYHELALICLDNHNKEEAVRLMKIALEKPILIESDKRRINEMRALLKKYVQE
jgi:tetratricopeptide (TPR) repeat protein